MSHPDPLHDRENEYPADPSGFPKKSSKEKALRGSSAEAHRTIVKSSHYEHHDKKNCKVCSTTK